MYHARTESSGPPATRIAPPTPEAAKPSAAQAMPPVLYSDHDIHPPGAPPPVAVHDRSRMLSDSIMEDMFEGLPDSLDQADSAGGAGIVDSVDDVDDVDERALSLWPSLAVTLGPRAPLEAGGQLIGGAGAVAAAGRPEADLFLGSSLSQTEGLGRFGVVRSNAGDFVV